jgi:hypothetical protein
LRVGEKLTLNPGNVVVTLEQKSGQRSRLRVEADESVKIVFPKKVGT